MGRTMGDHDEAIYRRQLGGDLYALERAAICVNTRAAWSELDAERAHSAKLAERVAELERELKDREAWLSLHEEREATDNDFRLALAASQAENVRLREVHVVFDGPPSHESGRFVECEDGLGNGISAGKWVQVGDLWHLVIANVLGPEVKP